MIQSHGNFGWPRVPISIFPKFGFLVSGSLWQLVHYISTATFCHSRLTGQIGDHISGRSPRSKHIHGIVDNGSPVPIAVITEAPDPGWIPLTRLDTLAAGRPPIKTVGLPCEIDPTQAGPDTKSPTTAAGIPPKSTVGTPGPMIVSPVTVMSPTRATGVGISALSGSNELSIFPIYVPPDGACKCNFVYATSMNSGIKEGIQDDITTVFDDC